MDHPIMLLADTVEYEGLVPGDSYTLSGILMDRTTGKAFVDRNGRNVVSFLDFEPEEEDGEATIIFELDPALIPEDVQELHLVAFETLSKGERIIATHADLGSDEQSVRIGIPIEEPLHEPVIPRPTPGSFPKTGDSASDPTMLLMAGAVLVGIAFLIGRSRTQHRRSNR